MRAIALAAALLALADAAAAEVIRDFEVDIAFDGVDAFRVEERIIYDFESERKRGIFRELPVAYGRGYAADYRIGASSPAAGAGRGMTNPPDFDDYCFAEPPSVGAFEAR